MGWWIALGIVVLLAVLPLGVSARYDTDGPVVKIILGPVKFTLFPRPKKKPKAEKKKAEQPKAGAVPEERPKAESAKQAAAEPAQKKAEPKKKSGGKLTDFLPLVKIVMSFLGDFRRMLRVNRLDLKLIMAADDPCDLAVNYGRAWAAVGNLLPQLEKLFVIKKRNIEVECDFTTEEMRVIARLDLTITLGRLLALAVVYAFRLIKEFLNIKNKRKGGAVNEPKST